MTNTTKEKDYLTQEERKAVGIHLYFDGRDYGQEKYVEKKHFVLTNPEAIKDFSVMSLAADFRGTGHSEWEVLLAMWMLEAARKAVEENCECDVSQVFNAHLLASPKHDGEDYRRLTPEDIWNHLNRFFIVEEESDTFCKITAKM